MTAWCTAKAPPKSISQNSIEFYSWKQWEKASNTKGIGIHCSFCNQRHKNREFQLFLRIRLSNTEPYWRDNAGEQGAIAQTGHEAIHGPPLFLIIRSQSSWVSSLTCFPTCRHVPLFIPDRPDPEPLAPPRHSGRPHTLPSVWSIPQGYLEPHDCPLFCACSKFTLRHLKREPFLQTLWRLVNFYQS